MTLLLQCHRLSHSMGTRTLFSDIDLAINFGDRAFLDRVTNRTVFLRDERLYNFDLPYTSAREALEEQDLAAAATREQEEKDIRRLEASAKRLATWGRVYDNEKLARKAKSMEKRIDRMKDEKTFVSRGSGLNLTVDVGGAQADRMLAIERCEIHAPDRSTLFHIEDLIIELNQPNFLILDEPTNHIDIQGKEELETQILDSKATVIITSHDRRFVDNIANRYLLIHSGQLREIHRPEAFYQMDRADRPLVAHENVVEKTELSELKELLF